MSDELRLEPNAEGWLGARDPRLRIGAAVLFALVTVSLHQPLAAALALVMALAMIVAADLSLRQLVPRLFALEIFMLLLLVTLPFTVSGEPLVKIGALTGTREGAVAALLIALKANAIVLALLTLVGTLDPVVLGHGLARLGVPPKLVHLLLLTVGQAHVLHREYVRLRQAMRARAFVPRSDRHTWKSYGYLVGMLLVRSFARSRRILAAMRCRGFKGRLYLLDASSWCRADSVYAAAAVTISASVLLLDRVL